MTAESQWEREVDALRQEMHRGQDRLDVRVDHCITEQFYLQAQEQNGRRFEGLSKQVTGIESSRENEAQERQRDRQQMRMVIVGAALTLITSIGVELLRMVANA